MSPKQHGPWLINDSTVKYRHKLLEVYEDQVTRPDQTPGVYATVRVKAGVSSGQFSLTFGAETTGPIDYNATPLAVQTALEALTAFNPGDVFVLGGSACHFVLMLRFVAPFA